MAESINYYYADHKFSKDEAKIAALELRTLAVAIIRADTLHDLKLVYEAATGLAQILSKYKHKERKYAIERSLRKGILDPLSDCIGAERNFQRRMWLTDSGTSPSDSVLSQIRQQFGDIPENLEVQIRALPALWLQNLEDRVSSFSDLKDCQIWVQKRLE